MKKLLIILALFCATESWAKTEKMTVFLKGGKQVVFSIEEAAKIVVENGNILIGNQKYMFSEIVRYEFDKKSGEGIENVDKDVMEIVWQEESIVVKTDVAAQDIHLLAIDGKEIQTEISQGQGQCTISLKNVPTGIFVLSVGSETMKLHKR